MTAASHLPAAHRLGGPSAGSVLPRLTSLRWLAALLVFAAHARGQFADLDVVTHMWVGRSGVSFFFVLSGFVLAWSHRAGDRSMSFYRRRFARIYPAYVASLLLWLGVSAYLRDDPGPWWAPFLLIQSWVNDQDYLSAVNSVAWSLSVEAFFYLLFPLLIPLARQLSRAGLVALVFSCVVIPLVLVWVGNADTERFLTWHWVTYALPVARLPEFVLGIALALLLRGGLLLPRAVAPATLLSLVALWWAADVPWLFQPVVVTVVPFAVLIYAAASADVAGRPATLLHRRWLILLGQWSYCFYLVHTFALAVVAFLVPGLEGVVGTVIALTLGIAGAAGLHYTVERPAERLLRGARQRPES